MIDKAITITPTSPRHMSAFRLKRLLPEKYRKVWMHLLTLEWVFLFQFEKSIPKSIKQSLQHRALILARIYVNSHRTEIPSVVEYDDHPHFSYLYQRLAVTSPDAFWHIVDISRGTFPFDLQEVEDDEWKPNCLPTDEILEAKRSLEDSAFRGKSSQ